MPGTAAVLRIGVARRMPSTGAAGEHDIEAERQTLAWI
jgi:hypothetical protein